MQVTTSSKLVRGLFHTLGIRTSLCLSFLTPPKKQSRRVLFCATHVWTCDIRKNEGNCLIVLDLCTLRQVLYEDLQRAGYMFFPKSETSIVILPKVEQHQFNSGCYLVWSLMIPQQMSLECFYGNMYIHFPSQWKLDSTYQFVLDRIAMFVVDVFSIIYVIFVFLCIRSALEEGQIVSTHTYNKCAIFFFLAFICV